MENRRGTCDLNGGLDGVARAVPRGSFGAPGFHFLGRSEHPFALDAQPVDPPDLLTGSKALDELFGLELSQRAADVREVDIEVVRELGRGLGGFECEEDALPILPTDDVATQLPHGLWVVKEL